jgi:hypothetical protein
MLRWNSTTGIFMLKTNLVVRRNVLLDRVASASLCSFTPWRCHSGDPNQHQCLVLSYILLHCGLPTQLEDQWYATLWGNDDAFAEIGAARWI